jgi:hypothetical protein
MRRASPRYRMATSDVGENAADRSWLISADGRYWKRAMPAAWHFHQVPKYTLDEKWFGVYRHCVSAGAPARISSAPSPPTSLFSVAVTDKSVVAPRRELPDVRTHARPHFR